MVKFPLLQPPDTHHVNAAIGWLGLGDATAAAGELANIPHERASHPDVLEVCWQVFAHQRMWDVALTTAEALVRLAPGRSTGWIDQSFALHELRRTEEAMTRLLRAQEQFPEQAIIPYNLACYACQLGDLLTARRWLQKTVKLQGREQTRRMAMEDADLAPLRDEIAKL
jgi:Flp pilus assembly protein TadD